MKKLPIIIFICLASYLEAFNPNRFPPPSKDFIEKESELIVVLGKNEVMSLSLLDLTAFIWDRYVRGPGGDFDYEKCNPKKLTSEQAKLPATILLHPDESNQGQWIPFLNAIKYHTHNGLQCGPLFSFNFDRKTDLFQLMTKIEQVRELYLKAGQSFVEINLVGHSLGAICSAEYAFNPELWVSNTCIKKVISIAGRLKNIEPPTDTPYYHYSYDVLERVDAIWDNIQKNRGTVELFTLAAEHDWLVPLESVLVGDDDDHMAIVPNSGHALISRSANTSNQVIKWLFY